MQSETRETGSGAVLPLVQKAQVAVWVSTYVPAGTSIVLASLSALAAMIAPRRLQSLATAPSHAVVAASSAVVSTANVAACTFSLTGGEYASSVTPGNPAQGGLVPTINEVWQQAPQVNARRVR